MVHGQQLIDLERATGTFFEPDLQAFFLPANWLIDFANQVYMNASSRSRSASSSGSTSSATSPSTSSATCSPPRWGWR